MGLALVCQVRKWILIDDRGVSREREVFEDEVGEEAGAIRGVDEVEEWEEAAWHC